MVALAAVAVAAGKDLFASQKKLIMRIGIAQVCVIFLTRALQDDKAKPEKKRSY